MAKLTLTELREKHEFKLLLSSVIVVLGTGTIVYHFIEKWPKKQLKTAKNS